MSNPPPVKPDADDRDRAAKALELRKSGMTYEQIAFDLGYGDESGPRKAVDRLLSRVEHHGVLEMRRLEGHRLDQLQAALWDPALRGDFDATKVILQVIERRCKLFGLNAPLAVRVDPEITDIEFARQVVELITSLASAGALGDALRGLGHVGWDAAAMLEREMRKAIPDGDDDGHDESEPWSNL